MSVGESEVFHNAAMDYRGAPITGGHAQMAYVRLCGIVDGMLLVKDREIEQLTDHIERLALDLALKETDNKVVTK